MTATYHTVVFSGPEKLARALDDGFVVIEQVWDGVANLETMEHALKRLGFPTHKQIGGNGTVLRFMSTPEGADAVASLLAAAKLTNRTVDSISRKFVKRRDLFAQFGTLYKLDATPQALMAILADLWRKPLMGTLQHWKRQR